MQVSFAASPFAGDEALPAIASAAATRVEAGERLTDTTLLWLVGGVVVVVWVAIAQLRVRIVRRHPPTVIVVLRWILLGYGLALIALTVRTQRRPAGPVVWILLAAMAILAIGLGIARGATTTIWTDGRGQTLRRGGGVVVAIWAISLATHLALSWLLDRYAPGAGPVTMLAYLVATIAAQNITVRRRASALSPPAVPR